MLTLQNELLKLHDMKESVLRDLSSIVNDVHISDYTYFEIELSTKFMNFDNELIDLIDKRIEIVEHQLFVLRYKKGLPFYLER